MGPYVEKYNVAIIFEINERVVNSNSCIFRRFVSLLEVRLAFELFHNTITAENAH